MSALTKIEQGTPYRIQSVNFSLFKFIYHTSITNEDAAILLYFRVIPNDISENQTITKLMDYIFDQTSI